MDRLRRDLNDLIELKAPLPEQDMIILNQVQRLIAKYHTEELGRYRQGTIEDSV